MGFIDLPASAAWRHHEAREGFESAFFGAEPPGYRFDGLSAAVEDGTAWAVGYTIWLDQRWTTRSARIWGRSAAVQREVQLDADGAGHWNINGASLPELDGCLDVDLESSVCTNTIPVHRLRMRVGESAGAPAAYVRALDLQVERLEQKYIRMQDDDTRQRYGYRAPRFGFECQLVYDASGLVLDYPGIATRVQ